MPRRRVGNFVGITPVVRIAPMTNNLKAERTLTAEELQKLFPNGVPVVAMKVLFPEKSGPLSTEEVRLILRSLSTQQPMGEVTDEMVERASKAMDEKFSEAFLDVWPDWDGLARLALNAASTPIRRAANE